MNQQNKKRFKLKHFWGNCNGELKHLNFKNDKTGEIIHGTYCKRCGKCTLEKKAIKNGNWEEIEL